MAAVCGGGVRVHVHVRACVPGLDLGWQHCGGVGACVCVRACACVCARWGPGGVGCGMWGGPPGAGRGSRGALRGVLGACVPGGVGRAWGSGVRPAAGPGGGGEARTSQVGWEAGNFGPAVGYPAWPDMSWSSVRGRTCLLEFKKTTAVENTLP
jgi:hypothetical protein